LFVLSILIVEGAMSSKKPTSRKGTSISTKGNPDYIDDWKEWQDNQFNPGHFTGGKQIPLFKNPGKPLIVGLGLLFMGLLSIVAFIINLAGFNPQSESFWSFLLPNLPTLVFTVIFLLAGYRMIRRGRKR
jgi:hypothetical protein